MKVYIADDSRVVVERLADLLKEVPGAQFVGRAGDVLEAMQCIHDTKPDALILDLQLPEAAGWKFFAPFGQISRDFRF